MSIYLQQPLEYPTRIGILRSAMTISIHADSHLDHEIHVSVVHWVIAQCEDDREFFIRTLEIPSNLPTVACNLHTDVPDEEVYMCERGDRTYQSRMCLRPPRQGREVTIIAGPHPTDGAAGMVLFTMFGGPAAPKEPGDPRLTPGEAEASRAFWSKAALSR